MLYSLFILEKSITASHDFKTLSKTKVVLQNVLKSINDLREDEEKFTNKRLIYKQFYWRSNEETPILSNIFDTIRVPGRT